jgi:DNA polymerase-3 subunit delta'
MSLKQVFCQDKVISALERAYASGKMPHAYIFAGPEGVGKFTTAKALAKLLLCKSPVKNNDLHDSCGSCASCIAFESNSHQDLNIVYKELFAFTEKGKEKGERIDKETGEAKKSPLSVSIEVVREFIVAKAQIRPVLSSRTVFIIEEAQKLTTQAQNALLKTLEEPPAFCTIILLCSKLEKLLPTIHSRCQVLNFGPIDEKIIVHKLQGIVDSKQALFWARFSQGSLGSALAWANLRNDESSAYDFKKQLIEKLSRLELADAVDFADWISKQVSGLSEILEKADPATSKSDLNRRTLRAAVMMIITALNDAMKLSVSSGQALVNADQENQVRSLASKFDAETAAEKIAAAYKAIEWADANVNEKLILEDLLLNLA